MTYLFVVFLETDVDKERLRKVSEELAIENSLPTFLISTDHSDEVLTKDMNHLNG